MTELEKLQRAKIYIEKLANGINPLDDTSIPDNDVVNNIRLSRCFFYVADTLRQVIEKGGSISISKPKKGKFIISPERAANFPFSNTGLPVSEIINRLNSLVDTESMKKLSHRQVTSWLVNIGMLTINVDSNGKNVKRPTSQGEEIGIYTEERNSMRGEYTVVMYNLEAQHFLIDNIDTMLHFETTSTGH